MSLCLICWPTWIFLETESLIEQIWQVCCAIESKRIKDLVHGYMGPTWAQSNNSNHSPFGTSSTTPEIIFTRCHLTCLWNTFDVSNHWCSNPWLFELDNKTLLSTQNFISYVLKHDHTLFELGSSIYSPRTCQQTQKNTNFNVIFLLFIYTSITIFCKFFTNFNIIFQP